MGEGRQPHRTLAPETGREFEDANHHRWRVWTALCIEDCEGYHGFVSVPSKRKGGELWFTPGTWVSAEDAFTAALAIFDQVLQAADEHVEVERVL